MALEEFLPYMPLIEILAFITAIAVLCYGLGRWTKGLEGKLDGISKKLDNISNGIEKMPEQFWSKFIDTYVMLGMVKGKGNPTKSRKEVLLEKARNYTITYEESLELKEMLEREAKQAQAAGDFLAFLVIMGILIFLAAIIGSLSDKS